MLIKNAIVGKISTTETHLKKFNNLLGRQTRTLTQSLDTFESRLYCAKSFVNRHRCKQSRHFITTRFFIILSTFTFYTVYKSLRVGNVIFIFAHKRR